MNATNKKTEITTAYIINIMIEKSGLSQRELAKRVGVTEVSISRYVKGTREPSFNVFRKIAIACNFSIHLSTNLGHEKIVIVTDNYGTRIFK